MNKKVLFFSLKLCLTDGLRAKKRSLFEKTRMAIKRERREEVPLCCKPGRRPCGSHRSWLEWNLPDLTELQLQTEGNLAGGGRNAVSGASQESEWEVQGLWES